jgi:hypothetical protein
MDFGIMLIGSAAVLGVARQEVSFQPLAKTRLGPVVSLNLGKASGQAYI